MSSRSKACPCFADEAAGARKVGPLVADMLADPGVEAGSEPAEMGLERMVWVVGMSMADSCVGVAPGELGKELPTGDRGVEPSAGEARVRVGVASAPAMVCEQERQQRESTGALESAPLSTSGTRLELTHGYAGLAAASAVPASILAGWIKVAGAAPVARRDWGVAGCACASRRRGIVVLVACGRRA